MAAKDSGSGSAAAKRLAEEKANRGRRAYPIQRRSDPAGRTGFGETSSSNLTWKGGPSGKKKNPDFMPARNTARAASYAAGGKRWNDTTAGIESMKGAIDYARQQRGMRNRPGRIGGY